MSVRSHPAPGVADSRASRRTGIAVAVALAIPLLALTSRGAEAEEANIDCAESLVACVERGETFVLIPGSGNFIETNVPVRSTAKAKRLYQEMLPDGFDMPVEPRLLLHAAEYFGGTDAPLAQDVPGLIDGNGGAGWGTHWMEMSMHMRVARTLADGSSEEGWYFIGIATDGNIAYSGIDTGYPKYRAHTTFERRDAADIPSYWSASSTVIGRDGFDHADPGTRATTLRVGWRETGGPVPSAAEQTMVGYWMNPVHQGPATERSVGRFMAPAEVSWLTADGHPDAAVVPPATAIERKAGLVDYQIEPDLTRYDDASEKPVPSLLAGTRATLADIVETTGTLPGWAYEVKQGFLFNQQRQIRDADGVDR